MKNVARYTSEIINIRIHSFVLSAEMKKSANCSTLVSAR